MNLEKSLEEFGLTEKEAKTYLASLELGPATIQSIAKKSGIERVNTYYIIEKLIRDGLVSKTIRNNKSLFVAERPQILAEIMERRTKKIKDLLPDLRAIAKEEKKPSIKFFEGEAGIKSIYEDSLTSKTEILAWNNTANLEVYMADYFHDYYKRRAKKGVFIRAIVNDMPTAHEYKKLDKELLREIRIVPKEMMDIVPECYVYENKVAFMSLRERIGVLIESKDIAEAQRKIFELAWIGAKNTKK
jgi:sugar-specific transcriptional regulator TrmB